MNYIGSDGHIYELVDQSNRTIKNLTTPSAYEAPLALKGSPLVGYVESSTNVQHAVYIASDDDIHDINLDTQDFLWHNRDMTTFADVNAPQPVSGSPLVAYIAYPGQSGESKHVDFIGPDYHVHEIWFNRHPL